MPLRDLEHALDADWDEGKHKRADNGRFGSGGGTANGLSDHPVEKMRDYTPKELDWEYEVEYKKYSSHFAPGAFKDRKDFQKQYDAAPLKHLSAQELEELSNTMGLVHFIKDEGSKEEKEARVKEVIGEHRRDVNAVLKAIDEGQTAPPIILKKGDRLRLMAGNTRLMAAAARGLNMPAKVIDVTDKVKKPVQDADQGWYCIAADGNPVGPFASQVIADTVADLVAGRRPPGLAFDRSMVKFSTGKGGERRIAFDRESVRFETIDGHMKIKRAPISKATVNPYKGSEIPGCEELGLDPDRVYMLLRDPAELAKSAASFAGVPLLIEHIPVSADDHPTNEVVGAVGTDVEFVSPYLMAPLSVWTREAIDVIEDDSQRELSSGYHYVPVMKAGIFQGKKYDGIMTQITGNHVALVEKGRAGPDVVIGDSAKPKSNRKETKMSKAVPLKSRTAIRLQAGLGAYLYPMLAADAKLDLVPIVSKVDYKKCMAMDSKTKKLRVKSAVIKKIGELVMDAAEPMMTPEAKEAMPAPTGQGGGIGPDDVIYKLIEHIIENKMGSGGAEPEAAVPELENDALEPSAAAAVPGAVGEEGGEGGEEEDPLAKKKKAIMDACMGKGMSEDDASEIANLSAGPDGAEDEFTDNSNVDNDGKVNGGKSGARDKHPSMDKGKGMDKKAMDAAIEAGVKKQVGAFTKQINEANLARAEVEPHVGKVSMALDSAPAIFKASLKTMGIDSAGVEDTAALRLVFRQAVKARTAKPAREGADMAMDAEGQASFIERYTYAATIHVRD
jgi:hypothetical protein